MWQTDVGDRVLKGAEAKVFQWGLERLVGEFTIYFWGDDEVPEFTEYEVGVHVFDVLSGPEKIAVLEHVGRALLVSFPTSQPHGIFTLRPMVNFTMQEMPAAPLRQDVFHSWEYSHRFAR